MPRENYQAYVTLERWQGYCDLIILEKNGLNERELTAHYFSLSFDHQGIKRYLRQKLIIPHRQYWAQKLQGYVQIDLAIALALLKDAYLQNMRFNTVVAIDEDCFIDFLRKSFLEANKNKLWRKMGLGNLTAAEFAQLCLSALKRMDGALLYDFMSLQKRKALSSREDFLLAVGKSLEKYTFLKSGLLEIRDLGVKSVVKVFIIVSTLNDEVKKITYELEILKQAEFMCLNSFGYLGSEVLSKEHPENPINYRVFCSVYHLPQPNLVIKYLEANPDIFLTGEFKGGTCYKLLRPENVSEFNYDIFSGIVCEFLITKQEVFIYAQQPLNLAKWEYKLVEALGNNIKFQQKYYLPVRKLYQAAILDLPIDKLLKQSQVKGVDSFPVQSALFLWRSRQGAVETLKKITEKNQHLTKNLCYFYQSTAKEKSPSFCEYYLCGDWLCLNVYNGNIKKEMSKLGSKVELIKTRSFNLQEELFLESFSGEKRWRMFKKINLMEQEAPFLKTMGLLPSVKGMAQSLGAIVQT